MRAWWGLRQDGTPRSFRELYFGVDNEPKKKKSTNAKFNYDLSEAPRGKNLQLLIKGGGYTQGRITNIHLANEMGIVAWCLIPDRNKDEEVRLGHLPPERQ